jgi:hypothetical protein
MSRGRIISAVVILVALYGLMKAGGGGSDARRAEPGRIPCPELKANEDAVSIPWKSLLYCQNPGGSIDLAWEPLGKTNEVELYVPDANRWRNEMPAWARDRRAQVLDRMLTLSKERGWDFVVREF